MATDPRPDDERQGADEPSSEGVPPITAWRQPGQTRLEALLEFVPHHVPALGALPGAVQRPTRPPDATPWEPGHAIRIQTLGGIVSKERRRYTIIGHDEYHHHVAKHRDGTIGTSQSLTHAQGQTVLVRRGEQVEEMSADWGRDALEVKGDARIKFHSRTTMLSGHISRRLDGGVVRMASMEGVICGGFFMRAIVGPSANMSLFCTGDVYGGAARVSINRSMLALMHYRAAQHAAWASLLYRRAANIVIEPVVPITADPGPRGRILAKLARLARAIDKVLTPLRMVLPPLDILLGVITFLPMLAFGLGMLAYNLIKKPIPIPQAGTPRVHNRNVGVDLDSFASMIYT